MILPLAIGPTAILITLLLVLLCIILSIIALVDIVKSEFRGNDKLVWVVIIISFPLIGSILYFTIGAQQKLKNQN